MKKQIITTAALALLVTGIIFSCKKKDETTPEEPTPTTTGGTTGATGPFSWQENGGAVINADSANWVGGTWGAGIRAYKGGFAKWFEINWSGANDISVGAKSGFGLNYIEASGAGDYYISATSGTLNITVSTNSVISGNITGAVVGQTNTPVTSLTATFTSLSKR